jgi:hypothetical protein
MSKFYVFLGLFTALLLTGPSLAAQKPDLKQVVAGKWKVIWYADDGKEINMEAKKQQLVLKSDGSGKMSMMGENVGEVVWSVVDKKHINFQDDPTSQPYLVKVSKYKNGRNMLFTGTMPTGVVREVYFEALSSKKD